MKCLLLGLASLLMADTPALASGEAPSVGSTTWEAGWGRMSSGALVSWQVSDVKSGRMNWAFLIPSSNNSVTDDGYRYWSPGEINCREGVYRAFTIFDGNIKILDALDKEVGKLASDFCTIYEDGFKDSPYYQ